MMILLEESMAGKQIANLTTAMKNGEKYVNVQIQQNHLEKSDDK